jgi:hypothetical protein
MDKSRVTPTLFPLSVLEHPRCPRCQLRMVVVAIEPAAAGRDFRTFECVRCEHTETIIVDDPIKSQEVGWLTSELKPPQ